MKLTTWQTIAVLGLLLAAVIAAHVFAPGATAFVVSVASTVIGTLFVTHDPGPKDPPGTPPALTVLTGGAAALLFCIIFAACAPFSDLEKAAAQGDNAAKLSLCRADARAAFYVDQKTIEESIAVYDACAKKAGGQ